MISPFNMYTNPQDGPPFAYPPRLVSENSTTFNQTTTQTFGNIQLQTQPNIEFNPKPTTSGKCSKLKLDLSFDSTLFVAGGSLDGRIDFQCFSKSKVKLGRIAVELNGFEGSFSE